MEAPPLERKLAAILAADVEGYSRLMHENEERTLAVLTAHRAIVDDLILAANGQIFGTAGDSVLAEFPSVVDAFHCAVAIQQALRKANAALPEASRMSLRIGINVGDVMVKDGDIFGDGVNIAARLEGLAASGGICVTRGVRDHLRDRIDTRFEDLGEHSVKNITRPVRVFSVAFDPDAEPSLPLERPRAAPRAGASNGGAEPEDLESTFWKSVQASDDEGEYRLYLQRFPDGVFAALAHKRLQDGPAENGNPDVELAFWETIKDSGNAKMLNAYLEKYPDGEFRELARILLDGLGETQKSL